MPTDTTPSPSTTDLGTRARRTARRQPDPDTVVRTHPRTRDVSPLGVARTAFELLTTGPSPLGLDTSGWPGLPNCVVPLDELRSRLLAASCPAETRDLVWQELVTRSRAEGAAWTVACVGLALPALLRDACQ